MVEFRFELQEDEMSMGESPTAGVAGFPNEKDDRLPYRLLTGPDDAAFCERISEALRSGYELYGSPAATFNGERVIVAQAIVLRGGPAAQ